MLQRLWLNQYHLEIGLRYPTLHFSTRKRTLVLFGGGGGGGCQGKEPRSRVKYEDETFSWTSSLGRVVLLFSTWRVS